ncbi:hypothetical protein EMCRGX_G014112 [Ephydatia muelleri]
MDQPRFGIIISTDVDLHAFPRKFCYLAVQRHIKASSTKTPYRCMLKTYDWTKHSSHSCEEPIHSQRAKKRSKTRGRLPGITPKVLKTDVEAIAPSQVSSQLEQPPLSANQALSVMDQLLCHICTKDLIQPLQLDCSAVVCSGCLSE